MILFDELEFAEKSQNNPLNVLHSKLEYVSKNENVSLIGISKYSLDASKLNRFIILSIQNSNEKIDELITITKGIVEKISEDLYKNH